MAQKEDKTTENLVHKTFRIEPDVLRVLELIPNSSELIRNSIREQLKKVHIARIPKTLNIIVMIGVKVLETVECDSLKDIEIKSKKLREKYTV